MWGRVARMVCCSHLGPGDAKIRRLMPSGTRIGTARATFAASCVVFALAAFAVLPLSQVRADALPIGHSALPGGAHVASANRARPAAASVGALYGHTEAVPGSASVHERASGEMSAAFSPHPLFMLGATGFGRVDTHRAGGKRKDSGAAFGSSFSARFRHELSPALRLAGDLSVLFPPANGVARGFKSTSFSLRAVGTYSFANQGEVSLNAGMLLDRSRFAVEDPANLTADDRVGAGMSESNALLVGAFASMPFAGFVVSGEWSWDLAVGSAAPSALASPMRFEIGAQRTLFKRFFAGGRVGASPSQRPDASQLARIEPRVWLSLNVGMVWDEPAPPPPPPAPKASPPKPAPKAVEEPQVAPPPSLPPGQIRGRVRSLRGGALRAKVEVQPLGQTFDTDAKGAFVIDVPPGRYTVHVHAEGHETQERPAEVEQDGVTILVIDLRRAKR